MSTSLTFQTELVAIMEVLTKAAVTEISKLVQDGYAVLHLEISRSHRENEELKRQLAIQRDTKTCSLNSRDCRVRLYRDERITTKDAVFDELAPGRRGGAECKKVDNQGKCDEKSLYAGEERAESQRIKVERLEEDLASSDPPHRLNICEKRAVESGGGDRAPIADAQTEVAVGMEGLVEQHSIRCGVWEDDKLDTALKAEPEHEAVHLQDARSDHLAGRPDSLGHECVLYERQGQVDTFFTHKIVESETQGPIHSYPLSEHNSDSLLAQSELRLIDATAKDGGKGVSSRGSLCGNDSAPFELGTDVCVTWNKESLSGLRSLQACGHAVFDGRHQPLPSTTQGFADTERPSCSYSVVHDDENHLIHSELEGSPNLSPLESNSDTTDSIGAALCGKSSTALSSSKMQRKEKRRPICTLCGKRLSCTQTLEAHMRIHTGQRPYSCTYCGKKFNQKGNLKTHLRTHTGQKPYSCSQCGKRFSDPGYLKRHQYVHTGERPFKCAECGKSFSFSNNLIRHRSVHTVRVM